MHPELSLTVSEHGKRGLKEQNTMDMRIAILESFKNSTT
jgi:hypothetical protein